MFIRFLQICFIIMMLWAIPRRWEQYKRESSTPQPILFDQSDMTYHKSRIEDPSTFNLQKDPNFPHLPQISEDDWVKQSVTSSAKRFNLPDPFKQEPIVNARVVKPEFRIEGVKPIQLDSATKARYDSLRRDMEAKMIEAKRVVDTLK